jgi:hypothetical protein
MKLRNLTPSVDKSRGQPAHRGMRPRIRQAMRRQATIGDGVICPIAAGAGIVEG